MRLWAKLLALMVIAVAVQRVADRYADRIDDTCFALRVGCAACVGQSPDAPHLLAAADRLRDRKMERHWAAHPELRDNGDRVGYLSDDGLPLHRRPAS